MRVLVIGAAGQLGTEVCKVFADRELSRADLTDADLALDVTDRGAVQRLIAEHVRPNLVINTAAAHNVPKCEQDPAHAFAVNATAARDVAAACAACGARLIHISTDYVFGCGGTRPYTETDPPAPLSVYGASKLAGEHLIAAACDDYAIVRTSGLYGAAPCRAKDGMNFVRLMLHLAATRPEVSVVTDETATPTYTVALAHQLRVIAERAEPGLYHATCNGSCTWHEFARAVFDYTGTDVTLVEATSADFPSPVRRPDYSVLQNKHLQDQGLDIMPDWQDALHAYLDTLAG
ncbi:MAG: dTDP-4-dehydrorhamnose reductase [Candidatus Hydrogenedentes bacterium]|nr:dTDP-4-dehydrorhamnose reductase [Candidatus Hydrogenedentota bacterium]